ncbi:hypothetical protein HZ996_10255 [Cryomorphaceae bacterium]|nr:hypothetical protein HZ996_10255 [Cryomorphaceae bacterium]
MKRTIVLLLALFVASTSLRAQQLNYNVEYDNPDIDPFWILNLQFLDLEVMSDNLSGLTFNVGLWGVVEPVNRIGIDYKLRRSILSFASFNYDGNPTLNDIQVGGYLTLSSKVKTKNTKIVLDIDEQDSYDGNTRTTTSTYIVIPAQRRTEFMVRGGYYHFSSAMDAEGLLAYGGDENTIAAFSEDVGRANYNGLYAGINLRNITNVFTRVDGWGYQFNSIASNFYADVLLIDATFTDPQVDGEPDVTDQVKDTRDALPVGFRIGLSGYQIEKKDRTDKKFGLSYNFEFGYRPYMGYFVGGGIGMTLVKMTK